MNLENHYIPHTFRLFGQTTKQTLKHFDRKLKNYENISKFEGCDLILFLKNKCNIRPTDLWEKQQYEKVFVKIYVGLFKGL